MSNKKRSIKKIIISYMLAMFILIFIVVCIVICILMQQINLNKMENIDNICRQTEYQIDTCISQLESYKQIVAENMDVQGLLETKGESEDFSRKVKDSLLPYIIQSGGQFGIILFDTNETSYDIMNDVDPDETDVINNIYKNYISEEPKDRICFFDIPGKMYDNLYVCLLSPIEKYNLKEVGKTRVGTVAVYVTVNKVAFWQSINSNSGVSINVSDDISDEKVFLVNKSSKSNGFGMIQKSRKVANTNWHINCILYDNPLHSPFGILLLWVVVLLVLLMCFIIVMEVVFTRTIDRPVSDIKTLLADYHISKKFISKPKSNVYEFSKIIDYVFKMIEKINSDARKIVHTQQVLYEKSLLEKEQLLYMYQLQINPHFLYNTLTCISGLAIEKDSESIVAIVESISDIFRYSLSESSETTVENEIYIAQKYISILKIRYPNKIDYRIEVDDEILDYPILKMILQPIIENSYKHGISPKEGGGLIVVKGYFKEDFLILAVCDNGVGMSPDEYERLCESLNHSSDIGMLTQKDKKIGILNINSRVKIRYGEKSGVEIKTEYGKYTEIRIKIFCGKDENIKTIPQNDDEVL